MGSFRQWGAPVRVQPSILRQHDVIVDILHLAKEYGELADHLEYKVSNTGNGGSKQWHEKAEATRATAKRHPDLISEGILNAIADAYDKLSIRADTIAAMDSLK